MAWAAQCPPTLFKPPLPFPIFPFLFGAALQSPAACIDEEVEQMMIRPFTLHPSPRLELYASHNAGNWTAGSSVPKQRFARAVRTYPVEQCNSAHLVPTVRFIVPPYSNPYNLLLLQPFAPRLTRSSKEILHLGNSQTRTFKITSFPLLCLDFVDLHIHCHAYPFITIEGHLHGFLCPSFLPRPFIPMNPHPPNLPDNVVHRRARPWSSRDYLSRLQIS